MYAKSALSNDEQLCERANDESRATKRRRDPDMTAGDGGEHRG